MLITTIIARNYLAHARVLARSFLTHNPGGRVVVLVIDRPGPEVRADEPFEVLTPAELPLAPAEMRRMATMYDVTELATALKPWLLRFLVGERGEGSVTYLDPDILVFTSLDDIDDLARRHSIVVAPHRLVPAADDSHEPNDLMFSLYGAYNLGFISVSSAAMPFVEWWSDRCRRHCIVQPPEGMFVDQRWIDLGLAYFEHHILRDAGCNVAWWNLDERPLTRETEGYVAGGSPLRFLHFSGFDPDVPHVFSRNNLRRPRVLLSNEPALRALCRDYTSRLEAEGWQDCRRLTYGYARAANGMTLDVPMRRVFREEVLFRERAAEENGADPDYPKDPFDPEDIDEFFALLRTPFPGSGVPRIPRYLHALYWNRPDLRHTFPDLRGLEGNHFLWWIRDRGWRELKLPPQLVPDEDALEPVDGGHAPRRQGVRVVGYLAAELGIGEAARSMVATLRELGEPHSVIYERNTGNRQREPDLVTGPSVGAGDDFDVNLVCVNAPGLDVCLDRYGSRFSRHRRTIGMWGWEVEEFPARMAESADLVDEIWTYSAFSARAIRRAVDKPVYRFPLPVVPGPVAQKSRAELQLPEGFLFLFCFDFHSVAERKNPVGVVDAFCRAFRPNEGPQLVLKSINGMADVVELERLRALALDRPDILIIDGYLDRADQRALMASCDAYVSLHRAEGFGYTLAEAMLAEKPVIATGYSGNLEFMNDDNSFLVGYEMIRVAEGCDPYPPTASWADPHLDEAVEHMRSVVAEPERSRTIALQAHRDIVERHSPAARVPLLAARLAAARAAAADPFRAWSSGSRAGRLASRVASRARGSDRAREATAGQEAKRRTSISAVKLPVLSSA